MQITLTVAQLQALHACKDGVETFRRLYGEQATVEWSRDTQLQILRGPLGRYVGSAHRAGFIQW